MMVFSFLLYYLIIVPISLLPFRAIYLFSDFLFLVLYRVAGYRVSVVRMNLKNAFPEKPDTELRKIETDFYRHLADVIVETLKSFTISNSEILRRAVLENPDLTDHYFHQGRSVLLCGGHYNNWEWLAISLDQQIKHKAGGIYTPLSNPFFENKMRSTRGKFGLQLIRIKDVASFFEKTRDQLTATVFGIDQSPRHPEKCHWMPFLSQDTGVMVGTEKYAKEYNYPVLFCSINKIKRGYYTYRISLITEEPRKEPENRIIETATHLIEKQIIQDPRYWLWTHKRWKHKRPENI